MSVTAEDVYDIIHSQLMWTIGIMIGILFTGGLISFGISCIFHLSGSHDPVIDKQHRFLRVYIVALLFFVLGFIIVEVLWCNVFTVSSFDSTSNQAANLAVFLANLIPVFVAALTNGLLVWRCYMVQKLPLYDHRLSKWQNVLRIFPAFLWGITLGARPISGPVSVQHSMRLHAVTGCIAAPLDLIPDSREPRIVIMNDALEATGLFSNVVLNIYATLFISFGLLKQRKVIQTTSVGNRVDASRYTVIAGIFLESAAINMPITIAVAVGIGLGAQFGTVLAPAAVAGQAFASVLVIHQVAVGRAFNRRQEKDPKELTVEKQIPSDHSRLIDTGSVDSC